MYYYSKEQRGRAAMADLSGNESVRRVVLYSLVELRSLSEKVENWMRVLGYPRKDLFAVKLALEEAIINAFRHGTRGDPNKVVRVNYIVTLAEVFIEVEDDGPGFDLSQVGDPLTENGQRFSGRGIFLMRVYMSGLSYNAQGNRVTLWRQRSAL